MATEKPGDDFDWVGAQHACNARDRFAALRRATFDDVARMNAEGAGLQTHEEDGYFVISRPARRTKPAMKVTFYLDGKNVDLTTDTPSGKATTLVASVSLSKHGECVFVVDGEELNSWELRQRVLSPLFFD
jgi:hypothetical protein